MNRRALLAAAPAVLLAGCGGSDDEGAGGTGEAIPDSETRRRGDLELIGQLLDVKRPAAAAYRTRFAPDGFAAFEREHVRRLEAETEDRGGAPRRATAEPPDVPGDEAGALRRLVEVEETSVAVLLDVLPKFGDPDLRTLAGELLAVEAQQLSELNARLGRTRLADPFVHGRRVL